MQGVLIDITEFVKNPVRSGIQRLVLQLIVHLRRRPEVAFVYFDSESVSFRRMPERVLTALEDKLFGGGSKEQLKSQIKIDMMKGAYELKVKRGQTIFIPEVFYAGDRLSFYSNILQEVDVKLAVIVFDFLPWLNPTYLAVTKGFFPASLPYLTLVRLAHSRLHISEATMQTYAKRITRSPPSQFDIVVALGADALAIPRQRFSSDRKIVCCVGAFDGKKGQELVYEAFARLNVDLELHFAGKIPEAPAAKYRALLNTTDPRVVIHGEVGDLNLSNLFSSSRASVFVSENEGFGLPALESLFVGLPLIAAASLPALYTIKDAGQIRLDVVDSDTVGSALMAIADNKTAECLWAAAETLSLPTWADFADACWKHLVKLDSASSRDAKECNDGKPSPEAQPRPRLNGLLDAPEHGFSGSRICQQ